MTRKEIKKLDLIWATLVKDKAGWKCEHCGVSGTRMEAAHVVGRRHRATRWGTFIDNDLCGHCLCHSCHQHYDEHGPLEQAIVNDTIGEQRKEDLQNYATQTIAKYQVFDEIKELLERLDHERILHTQDKNRT